MFIWRNLDPKVLAAVLMMAARAYQKRTAAKRQATPSHAARVPIRVVEGKSGSQGDRDARHV